MAVAVITAKAVNATVYVQADEAPYLYGWYTVPGKDNRQFNGVWPGKLMTQTVKKTNKNGEEIEFWYQTFDFPETSSFNIIFNNGQEGVNKVQTSNISDIASDRYFTYDGKTGKYTDITEDFGVEIPDVEILSVAIKSELNWDEQVFFTEIEKNAKYTYTLSLTDEQLEPLEHILHFYFMVNSSAELKWNSDGLIKNDPNNWLELDPAFEKNQDFSIDFSKIEIRDIFFTLDFAGGKDIYQGWTLTIAEGTSGVYGMTYNPTTKPQTRYNIQGQQVKDGYKGIVVTKGKKMLVK